MNVPVKPGFDSGQTVADADQPPVTANDSQNLTATPEIESAPQSRKIEQPENFEYFENSLENLSKELQKNYRKFSLSYPKDWTQNKFDKNQNKVDDKFIDISINDDGIPIEQFMVSYYTSHGTFEQDREKFPEIVKKASDDIKKSPLPNYKLVSSGETTLNGWRAYEMKFQGEGTTRGGNKIKLWGRRFFIPAARPGERKGLVVTLLATSLSENVKSVDDLGKKGELEKILYTFEPDRNY